MVVRSYDSVPKWSTMVRLCSQPSPGIPGWLLFVPIWSNMARLCSQLSPGILDWLLSAQSLAFYGAIQQVQPVWQVHRVTTPCHTAQNYTASWERKGNKISDQLDPHSSGCTLDSNGGVPPLKRNKVEGNRASKLEVSLKIKMSDLNSKFSAWEIGRQEFEPPLWL